MGFLVSRHLKNIFISRETKINPTFLASPINNYKHKTVKTCRGVKKKKKSMTKRVALFLNEKARRWEKGSVPFLEEKN